MTRQSLPLGGIIRTAIQTLADHITPLATAAAVVVFPITIWEGALPAPVAPGTAKATALTPAQLGQLLTGLRPWLLPVAVDALASYLMTAALVWMFAEALAGRTPTAVDGYRAAFSRLGALLTAGLAQLLVIVAATIVFSIPVAVLRGGPAALVLFAGLAGIGVYLSLVTQAVMAEGVGFLAAVRRSATLVSGVFWPVLGLILVGAVVSALFGTLSALPTSAGITFATRAVSELISALVAVTAGLLPAALLTTLYATRSGKMPDLADRPA